LRGSYADDLRNGQSQPSFVKASQETTERPHVKPISYAEIDNQTPAVPGFSDSIVAGDRNAKQSDSARKLERSSQQVTRDTQKLSIEPNAREQAEVEVEEKKKDGEMYVKARLSISHTANETQE
jgi:serine/threonine-protein kinase PRP4